MSLLLDDDLYEILHHVSGGRTVDAWATQVIVKLVLDNQQLRKTLQVSRALEPNHFEKHQMEAVYMPEYIQTSQIIAHDDRVNQAAKNPRAILDKYKNQYPEVDTFIQQFDDTVKNSTPKGGSNVGS